MLTHRTPLATPAMPQPPEPLAADIGSHWALDPAYAFLNHGSFGARPLAVMQAQTARRREFEARPIEWLDRRRNAMIDQAKAALGDFIGIKPANLGFVTNATGGINAVLRSLEVNGAFKPGDELLSTNHVYNAVRKTIKYIAQRADARSIEIEVPLPLRSTGEIVDIIEASMNERTRLLVIDHITSPTAVIFPVQRLIEICQERGVDVLIDGAHAPGMVPLNIEELGAAYYAGNLHKWTCAPVGSAFLWVRPDKQKGIHPTTISHFLDESYVSEFNWQGTRDITPWLCVQDSIQYIEQFGWERVRRHNHQLAVWAQAMLCRQWEVEPATPLDGSMIGSMATVPLPGVDRLRAKFGEFLAVREALYSRYKIEVPVIDWGGRWWVRPCCHIYNRPEQYELLAESVLELIA